MPSDVTTEYLLNDCGIDPTRRAETLSQTEFRTLATGWSNLQSAASKD